jgi:hypothetical protein
MTDATFPPKRPPVFLSQADISAFLSQLAIAEMDAAADRARIAEMDAADRARDARLAAIDRRHRREDVRRANSQFVERLRREIVGDPVRQYWDEKILAAYRALASRALTGYGR